jgi:hypothetical protein
MEEFDEFGTTTAPNVVVLDGANLLHQSATSYSLVRLKSVLREITARGWPTLTVLKYGTLNHALSSDGFPEEDKTELNRMVTHGEIRLISKDGDRSIDDRFAIATALKNNGWVVSNDRYKDHYSALEELAREVDVALLKERHIRVFFPDNLEDSPCFKPELPTRKQSKAQERLLTQLATNMTANTSLSVRLKGNDFERHDHSLPVGRPIGRLEFGAKIDEKSRRGLSRVHLRIDVDVEGNYFVTDLSSTNGVVMNGFKLPSNVPWPWKPEDRIQLARLRMKLLLA